MSESGHLGGAAEMKPQRLRGALSLPKIIGLIVAVTILLSLLFFSFWQRLNAKVEDILKEQFNRQQLELARKIADNVESYFDFLESELLAFPWRLHAMSLKSPGVEEYLTARSRELQKLGVLELGWYGADGRLIKAYGRPAITDSEAFTDVLPADLLSWIKDPVHKGQLFLGKVERTAEGPWQGRRIMRLISPLYPDPAATWPSGALVLVLDPHFIAGKVTEGVRSGETGYSWIIDQNGIFLAHYEQTFVGEDALEIRRQRNPQISFRQLKELHERLLRGEEGLTVYVSGWHREQIAEMEKLCAFTPIRFDKGLIRGVTEVADPKHNLWGVAVVAPVNEVAGSVGQVMHQELFLVVVFFLALLTGAIALMAVTLNWNKVLAREVDLKTEELLESQKRLVKSERFAAIGEAASYVSHEIKNPLMVIGGLARQVARQLTDHPVLQEKLQVIQNEVQRLENFLGDLRDFTRPALPAKQEINLNALIQEVDALMEGEAKSKGVLLEEKLDQQLPTLKADPNQLKQVLLNLIKNAFEALEAGGRVTLTTGREDRQVWFSVQDNGPGMTPEVLEKIFNPFFTTKEKGTGLGLAVIHKIIADHQGVIIVESQPREGTTVTVKLPLEG
jgi:two-component system sensor histidine kinase HydH